VNKAKQLRQLIEAPEILVMPGIFDGFSARLSRASGFSAGFLTGSGISESSLGWADQGIMGLEENLRVTRALAACCDLPLIADADTGYGNAVNVHFTIRAFERAGVCGVMIEDQVWPKRCGHMKGKEVISAEEGAAKIRAAADARVDPDLVIMSRTDTLATHGIEEVVRRLNIYAEAGADLLFCDAVMKVEDIKAIAKGVSKPFCVNMGFGIRQRSTTPLLSSKNLQDLGVGVVIYPRLLTAGAINGMKQAVAALKQSMQTGDVVDRPDLVVSFEELNDLVGIRELEALEQRYLLPDHYARKYAESSGH
jgi:2-methylisocitrate lyase-like PEP mutase family enzyme